MLVVEDDSFTRQLLTQVLTDADWSVACASTIPEAMDLIEPFEPHVLLCDLDLGPRPSGVDLCQRVAREWPWIGIVVLTAHSSPELVVRNALDLPAEILYLVKSDLGSPQEVVAALDAAVSGTFNKVARRSIGGSTIEISTEQAAVLMLIAQAYSNSAIAGERGTSVRAVEAMVQRLFAALGLEVQPETNMRVAAARMWASGLVKVHK